MTSAEHIAREFVKVFERLSPIFNPGSKSPGPAPWEQVPLKYRQLLVATIGALIKAGVIQPGRR